MARRKQELSRGSWLRRLDASGAADRETLAAQLVPHELAALGSYYWEGWARDEQLPPQGELSDAWRTWLICAGRGFGKTRAGAEWVRDVARNDGAARIALVGASLAEVRSVMVEGDSGVLAAAPGALAPVYEPSLKRLTWENGALAFLYSAAEPESLRGPQHSHASGPGSEGSIRERSARAARCACPASRYLYPFGPSRGPCGRRYVSRRRPSQRGMDRSGGLSRDLAGYALGIPGSLRRDADFRSETRCHPHLARRLEPVAADPRPHRGDGCRRRSAWRYCNTSGKSSGCRYSSRELGELEMVGLVCSYRDGHPA